MKKLLKYSIVLALCFLMAFSVMACSTKSPSVSSVKKSVKSSSSQAPSSSSQTISSTSQAQNSSFINSSISNSSSISSSSSSISSSSSSSSVVSSSSSSSSASSIISSSSSQSLSTSSSSSISSVMSNSSTQSTISSIQSQNSSSNSLSTTINSNSISQSTSTSQSSSSSSGGSSDPTVDVSDYIIQESTVPFKIQYDEQAPFDGEGNSEASMMSGHDIGWQNWSLPIGNGYIGTNVFGRTEVERIQITEKTLSNPWQYVHTENGNTSYPAIGGLNNFSETYIDFGHNNGSVSNYSRWLDLNTATSGVSYTYNGVNYTREYFTSYPDNALVIRLDASQSGNLSFVLRPTVPYEQEYMKYPADGYGKTGQVVSSVSNGVGRIELSGKMTYYDVDFVGYYEVYTSGGTVSATTCQNAKGETDGTITVKDATSAYIVFTCGTDYELSEEIFLTSQYDRNKPTAKTTLQDAKNKVNIYLNAINNGIAGKSYEQAYTYLKNRHLADYQNLYSRVNINLNFAQTDLNMSTNDLLAKYQAGNSSSYLEALLLQYGRYLLISSSRKGALPANLQGAWNCYNIPAWSSGYWNNVNIQMNYWNAFSTNLAETFESYVDYLDAFIVQAKVNASNEVNTHNPSVSGQDGGNGWTIGVASNPFFIGSDRSCGNMGFTTQVYWDYYQFTKDPQVLEKVYEILIEAARYVTKCVKNYDGLYLVEYCDSPEMYVNGVWYYTTGTTYAQTLAYLNNYAVLQCAKDLGIDVTNNTVLSKEENAILKTILEQIDKYDPINVGLSGQIKEFREETYYGSMGNPLHRHISQLVGLFPGNLINSSTEAWLDAAIVSVNGRNDGLKPFTWDNYDATEAYTVGWSWAHKAALYARAGLGDQAQEMILGCTKGATLENLLMVCGKVFQIEASMGTSAALAEMLLQSHEDFVQPLPAIPSNWTTGTYKGLVARGNFEVSAAWQNGLATSFNILSKNGEKLSVKYPSITQAKVYTSKGVAVPYEIVGQDVISFNTQAGETYVIYGFTKVETPNKVNKLDYEVVGYGEFDFAWEKVSGASSYNVYVALENAARYTLIGTVTNNGFTYKMPSGQENVRATFAITAVNSSNRESARTLAYYNPTDTTPSINGVSWSVLSDGKMQVIVNANEVVAKYVLWEAKQGENDYAKVAESIYPTIIGGTYSATSQYAVTAISIDGRETTKYVLSSGYNVNNILSGKQFIPTDSAQANIYQTAYGYPTLTDGINYKEFEGRFSTKSHGFIDATIDLGASYLLDEFRIYVFEQNLAQAGSLIELYIMSNGEWTKVVSAESGHLSNYVVYAGNGTSVSWLAFDLGGVSAEKIRLSVPSAGSTTYITYYEVECSGVLDPSVKGEFSSNILSGKQFVPSSQGASNIYNSDYGYQTLTDGILYNENSGRFSSKQNGLLEGTVDLGGIYQLAEFKIHLYKDDITKAGSSILIQVYYAGEWKTIKEVANADLASYKVANPNTAYGYLSFKFDYIKAEQIRVYIPSCTSSGWITFYEFECSGTFVDNITTVIQNVFTGKKFTPTAAAQASVLGATWWKGSGYEGLTDGITNADNAVGRFSTIMNTSGMMDATLELDGVYKLYDLKFHLYDKGGNAVLSTVGANLTIELYYNGVWTKVINCSNNATIGNYLTTVSGDYNDYLLFSLGGVKAEKVRVYIGASQTANGTTYEEFTCSGIKEVGSGLEDTQTNILKNANATIEGGTASSTNKLANAFDGNNTSYLETTDTDGKYSIVIDLGYPRALYSLKIYELSNPLNLIDGVISTASNNTKVEVYVDGYWLTVVSNEQLKVGEYTIFNLNGLKCSKVRISFENTRSFDDSTTRSAQIAEIECTAQVEINRTELITALNQLGFSQMQNTGYLYNETYKKYAEYLKDYTLTQEVLDSLVEEVNALLN